MSLMTWTIEVRVDFDDKDKEELALKAVKANAKEILATMRLLADNRQPQMSLSTSDFFAGTTDVDLFTEDELA